MVKLTDEQKKQLIDNAINAYEIALPIRSSKGDFLALEQQMFPFNESCANISSLIHYIAKADLKIPDEENEVFHVLFKPPGCSGVSHFINRIHGEIIDASIEQFNHILKLDYKFSRYETDTNYYVDMKPKISMSIEGIEEEIKAYEHEETIKFIQEGGLEKLRNMHKEAKQERSLYYKFKQWLKLN